MLHKPHWTDGLELTSHHFQLVDRYHEQFVDQRLRALFDYGWGIHEIRWDTRAIEAGTVSLLKLDAILADGTPMSFDAADGAAGPSIPVRDLGPKNVLHVYVGVPRLRSGANVELDARAAAAAGGSPLRYVKESVQVADLATGGDPLRVECLRPNVRLLLEGEPLQDCDVLPCARIVRTASGRLTFDDAFVPPILAVGASRYLRGELRRALDALLTRQALQARTSPRDVNEAVQRWIGSLIGSFVPRVADLVHQRFVHPLVAYRTLAEIVGALTPFTRTGAHRIPPFQFDQLGPVFHELFAGLAAVLDALAAEHHKNIPLVRTDDSTLLADLQEPAVFRNDFFLRVVGNDAEELRGGVPRHFKVAAWSELGEVVRTATGGVPLRHDPRPPSTLPAGSGAVYFKLERGGNLFASVIKTGQLGIHHTLGLPVSEVSLFAVEPGAP